MMPLFLLGMGLTLFGLSLFFWGSSEQAAEETRMRNEALARAIADAIAEVLDRDEPHQLDLFETKP